MNRVKRLIETIHSLIEGEFNGYVKINFSQGSLGRVEQSEELDETITHLGNRKDKSKSDDENLLYDNVLEIRDSADVKGAFGQTQRSDHDRRAGNNHYAGYEKRCGVDRRSGWDRRSGRDQNGQAPDINLKKQSKTNNITDKQKQKNANQRDTEK